MFNKVFIEKSCLSHPRAKHILDKLKRDDPIVIDDHEAFFNKVKKPYLQKRDNLNLFIAEKKGTLIKEAPDAYGLDNGKHYYFIHAYNCIYECHYCYLQGYFHSPDIVLFINYNDIGKNIESLCADPKETYWFHAGEFSDSLALSHITDEVPFFYRLFKNLKNAKLELRTKSSNIKAILKQEPLENIITSFSLSPQPALQKTEEKTPSLISRLKAIKKLSDLGHPIGIHLDPIIYTEGLKEEYEQLAKQILQHLRIELLQYISIGVVRFSKESYYQVKKSYPQSYFLAEDMNTSFDGKIRYPRPIRQWILSQVKETFIKAGVDHKKIYLCMED